MQNLNYNFDVTAAVDVVVVVVEVAVDKIKWSAAHVCPGIKLLNCFGLFRPFFFKLLLLFVLWKPSLTWNKLQRQKHKAVKQIKFCDIIKIAGALLS